MSTTTPENNYPSPEAASAPKAPYERKLRPNHTGVLDTDTELALVWSGYVVGLDEFAGLDNQFIKPEDIKAEESAARRQLKLIEGWNPNDDDFFTYLTTVKEREEAVQRNNYPQSLQAKFAARTLRDVDGIMSVFKGIDDSLKYLSDGLSPTEAAEQRARFINSLIEQHNQVIDRKNGVVPKPAETEPTRPVEEFIIPESPEERAKRTNEAREAVDTAFGDTPEKKRASEVVRQVVDAAKGATYIHTDVPSISLRYGEDQHEPHRSGFQTFGDAPKAELSTAHDTRRWAQKGEAVVFQPVTTPTYTTESYVVSTNFLGRKKMGERRVQSGEVPTMILNRFTGQEEPGVKVAYQFDSNGLHYNTSYLPRYDTRSGRPGNMLEVAAIVPQSVAEAFRQALADDPLIARNYAEMVTRNNGVTEEAWNKGTPDKHGLTAGEYRAPMRPPYEKLPDDWQIHIVDRN